MTRLKRMVAQWAPEKKEHRFVSAPRGPHKLGASLPLLLIIRDKLNLADTGREAKKIITSRGVLVDGKVCADHRRGLGLFDSLSLPKANKNYRMAGLELKEIPASEAGTKICKIIGKQSVAGGKIQASLHDGRNLLLEKNSYAVGDSLLIEVPSQKISGHLKFEPGGLVLVIKGKNSGRLAHVHKIERGINKKLWLSSAEGKEKFEAPFDGVIVVGKEKPAISLGEKNG